MTKNTLRRMCLMMGVMLLSLTPVVETQAAKKAQTEVIIEKPKAALNYTKLQLKVNKQKKLVVRQYKGKVKWSSSDKKVAKVTKEGIVTARSVGDAVIYAQLDKKQLRCKVRVVERVTHINEWAENKGRFYFYNSYGIKSSGRRRIGDKYYYFDSEGCQRVGWVKIKGDYYYYNIGKKAKGYLVTNETINGIRLQKDGKAKLTDNNRDKVEYLVAANEICFDYVNYNMTKNEALKKMFKLMATGEIISYYNYGGFKNQKNWDQYYASYYFERGIGDCYTAGVVFGYFATALGFDDVYVQSSGGHGWCKIGDKYYDPNWAAWGTDDIYEGYAVPPELCGKNGRIRWNTQGKYSIKIS